MPVVYVFLDRYTNISYTSYPQQTEPLMWVMNFALAADTRRARCHLLSCLVQVEPIAMPAGEGAGHVPSWEKVGAPLSRAFDVLAAIC